MTPEWLPPTLLLAAIAAGTLALRREFPAEGVWRPLTLQLAIALTAAGLTAAAGLAIAQAAALGAIAAIASAIAITDVRRLLVPDTLVLALAAVAFVAPQAPTLALQAAGAALLGALFLAVRALYYLRRRAEGLGLGDVKLAAVAGFLLGPLLALQMTAGAAVATIAWMVLAPASRRAPAPLGAALAVGTIIATTLTMAGAS